MLGIGIIPKIHVFVAASITIIIVFARDSNVTSVGYAIVGVGSSIFIIVESGTIAQETVIIDVTVNGMGSTSSGIHRRHYFYMWQT